MEMTIEEVVKIINIKILRVESDIFFVNNNAGPHGDWPIRARERLDTLLECRAVVQAVVQSNTSDG